MQSEQHRGGLPQESSSVVSKKQTHTLKNAGRSEFSQHPYLAGNFRPVRQEFDLLPCELLRGVIPQELAGGQYIRNGANAYFPPTPEEGYHLLVPSFAVPIRIVLTLSRWNSVLMVMACSPACSFVQNPTVE